MAAWIVFLLICFALSTATAFLAAEPKIDGPGADPARAASSPLASFLVVWFVLFFSFFYLPQFLLGLLEQATGAPQVFGLPLILALLVVGLPALLLCWRERGNLAENRRDLSAVSGRASLARYWAKQPLECLLLALVAAMSVYNIALRSFGLPGGFESQAYVLPNSLYLVMTGSLQPWSDGATHTYPANQAIYNAVFLRLLPEGMVSVVNPPFLVPLIASVYAMARALGAGTRASLLAAVGIVSVPLVGKQAFGNYTDIAGTAFITAAIYLVLARPALRISCLFVAGLSAGLAFGFKSLHLVSIVFLCAALVVQEVFWRGGPGTEPAVSRIPRALVVFGLGVLLTSGFWLLRNYVNYGNPVYPAELPLMGDLFGWRGALDADLTGQSATQFNWVKSVAGWLVYPWVEWHYNDQGYSGRSGLGIFFAALFPASLLATGVAVFKGAFGPSQATADGYAAVWPRILLHLAGAAFVIMAWWVADNRQPRYAVASMAFLFPVFAWTLSQLAGRAGQVVNVCLAVAIAATFGLYLSSQSIRFVSKSVLVPSRERHSMYEYPQAIDHLPAGAKIINLTNRAGNYKLFGQGLSNQVVAYVDAVRLLAPDYPAEKRTLSTPTELGEINLCRPEVRDSGATHLYAHGNVTIADCDEMRLVEVDRLAVNKVNNKPLPNPRILYAIDKAAN
ncbi:MAG: hypothetical protein AAF495_06510 [Pseudomonadota bacterium]